MNQVLGGKVERATVQEYGRTEVAVNTASPLFDGVSEQTVCWMSHFDYISRMAPGFVSIGKTKDCPVAACECTEPRLQPYG